MQKPMMVVFGLRQPVVALMITHCRDVEGRWGIEWLIIGGALQHAYLNPADFSNAAMALEAYWMVLNDVPYAQRSGALQSVDGVLRSACGWPLKKYTSRTC